MWAEEAMWLLKLKSLPHCLLHTVQKKGLSFGPSKGWGGAAAAEGREENGSGGGAPLRKKRGGGGGGGPEAEVEMKSGMTSCPVMKKCSGRALYHSLQKA
jgi:hypothetical protein